ncbi:LysR family transcriptional regulator [Bacillus gobiensis]|uniref:LysR family transcriptional regulator n=1 Tax=Bacillus gobiensis TaxID=1441095 RepID=UPI003D23AFA3
MDLKWLQTFVTAAKNENFRQTAETLFISQPSVTVHMKLLEKELGIKLFERKGRKISLTEEGRQYLPYALKLLEDYEDSMADLHRFRQGYSNTLSLAISPLIADTVMPYVLKRFTTVNPEIEITVTISESDEIANMINDNQADIGLSLLNAPQSSLICRSLYQDPVILVAPHDGWDESAPPIDCAELFENNLLFTHSHPVYWDDLLSNLRMKYPFIRTMKVTQSYITKRFISEGLGVSFLPSSIVRRELMEGRLIKVECNSIQLPTTGAYVLFKHENAKEKKFLEFLSHFRF